MRFPLRRAVITALALGPLALFSGAYSLAVAMDTSEPQLAQRLYPDLPLTKVRLGDLAIAQALARQGVAGEAGASEASVGDTARKARRAVNPARANAMLRDPAALLSPDTRLRIEAGALSGLRVSPYTAGALRQLALIEPDPERRGLLLALARAVTRRDLAGTTQLAQLHLEAGEVDEGMALIDEALSISSALDATIFPLLLGASDMPEFAPVLRSVLQEDPAWAERLAQRALQDPRSAAQFVSAAAALPATSPARKRDYGAPLVEMLAQALDPRAAFAAHAIYAPAPQDVSAFGTRPLAPVDWQLVDGLEAGARLVGTRRAPVAEIFARPRRAGPAAQIMTQLAPGAYALDFTLADPRGSGGGLRLDRVCLAKGRELETTMIKAPLDGSRQRARLAFRVTGECPFQLLRMNVEAGGEAVSVLVGEVALTQTGSAQP